jgi:hypothetical protein
MMKPFFCSSGERIRSTACPSPFCQSQVPVQTMVAWYDDPSMFGYIVFSGLVVVFSIIIYLSKPRSTRGTLSLPCLPPFRSVGGVLSQRLGKLFSLLTCISIVVASLVRVSSVALSGEWQKYKLLVKKDISHNVRLFRFALQSQTTMLGLPVGQHVSVRGPAGPNGAVVSRSYTPTTLDQQLGFFDLVIKIYNVPDKEGRIGQLTPWLDQQPVGSVIEIKGPSGGIHVRE